MHLHEEVERTLRVAETALARLRRCNVPAHPRNLLVWYHYEDRSDAPLMAAVDRIRAQQGALRAADYATLYDAHLATHYGAQPEEQDLGDKMDDALELLSSARKLAVDLGSALVSADGAQPTPAQTLIAYDLNLAHSELEQQLFEARAAMLALQNDLQSIRVRASTDPQTLLATRSHFEAALRVSLTEGRPFSLLVTDIDHFKSFNDRYGHLMGDAVLRVVADTVRGLVREQDIAARYGGEEFVVVLPHLGLEAAQQMAENIRRAVMEVDLSELLADGRIVSRVTMSIGVARSRVSDTSSSIMERADRCLYAAKHAGRNRTVSEADMSADTSLHRVA